MNDYSPQWSATIFAAIILNLLAVTGFSFVAEKIAPEPKIVDATAFEWIDVDLSDEAILVDAAEISAAPIKENSSPFNAQDIFVPELQIPAVEEFKPPEIKPIERPQPVARPQNIPQPLPKVETPAQPKTDTPDEKQELIQPPVALTEIYPEKVDSFGYKGFVAIAVTIDANGKVTETEILQSSGQAAVDDIAIKAAVQWTFRPALDQKNRPLPSVKIIVFDFSKFS